MDNYVGKRLDGRYEVQEIIGVGGMSVVYKAYDNVDDRIVAVKILKDEFLQNDDFVRRFKNESKAISLLNHPNIVKVYDVSVSETLQYIVMEYVDGMTLREYLNERGGKLTSRETVHFISQILKALDHAHRNGVVHRDIKPQNIMVLRDGSVKVTDFGIACLTSASQTLTQEALGSVHYISPEQARGDRIDARSDSDVNADQVSQAIASYLEKVGIKAEVNLLPRASFYEKTDAENLQSSFFMAGWGDSSGEGMVIFNDMLYTYDGKPGMGEGNRGHYSNAEVDALLDQASVETDQAKRAALVEQVDQIARDEAAYIPLFFKHNIFGVRTGIQYTPSCDDHILAWDFTF